MRPGRHHTSAGYRVSVLHRPRGMYEGRTYVSRPTESSSMDAGPRSELLGREVAPVDEAREIMGVVRTS